MPMPRLWGGTVSMRRPPRRISPCVAASKPASIIRQVVLPEPEGPSIVRNSPLAMARSRPFTTSVSPS